jgi:hypothetical protein
VKQGRVGVFLDERALRELEEEGAIEAARGAVIDVLDAGLMAQPSGRTRPHA